ERALDLAKVDSFESVSGKGVIGQIEGHAVALGNRSLLEDLHTDPNDFADQAEGLRADGQTVMFVTVDGRPAGLVGVADPIKRTTPDAIKQLHENGIRIVMLTGDSRTTANAVAEKLKIDEVVAE